MKLEGYVHSVYRSLEGVEKYPAPFLQVDFEGIEGDRHAGYLKPADGRNKEYELGSPMRNERQWSAVSIEELEDIARSMRIPTIEPGWLGANLALAGIPNFTSLPNGSKLCFKEGAVLLIEGENLPCMKPGRIIASRSSGTANEFPKIAKGKRGLVGVVERPGVIRVQDLVTAIFYEPRTYSFPA